MMMKKTLSFFLMILAKMNAFLHVPPDFCHDIAVNLVKTSTSLLPAADSIGHHILHTNEKIIYYLLDNKDISMEVKKPLILNLIKAAQMGDNTGGEILKNYEQFVDKLL